MIDRGRDSIPPLPRGLPRQAVSRGAGPAEAHAIIPAKAHSRHSRESGNPSILVKTPHASILPTQPYGALHHWTPVGWIRGS